MRFAQYESGRTIEMWGYYSFEYYELHDSVATCADYENNWSSEYYWILKSLVLVLTLWHKVDSVYPITAHL